MARFANGKEPIQSDKYDVQNTNTITLLYQHSLFRFSPKMIPVTSDLGLYGVVGGMEVGMKPNCDLNLLTDNVKRNLDVMFIKH